VVWFRISTALQELDQGGKLIPGFRHIHNLLIDLVQPEDGQEVQLFFSIMAGDLGLA
jgi:hypothetical protein